MKRSALMALGIALIAMPLAAADFDLSGWLSWVDPMGDVEKEPSIDFDQELGFGIGFNVFWGPRFSTEFAVYSVEPDVLVTRAIGIDATAQNTIGINAISFTAIAQYHFRVDQRWSPYIGAGAAFALFDDVNDPGDLDDLDLQEIDFAEDYGFAINGGVNWNFAERWRVNLDAKYVPIESDANIIAAGRPEIEADIGYSPLILSAGVTVRFK